MEGEVGGQVKESSDALTSTVMVDGVLYRFKLRTSESTISGSKAPKSSHYVDLSQYPPGTDIEYELHLDGSRVVSKVPRWAHEKWLRKYQNAAGDPITPQDTSPTGTTLRDAAAAADGGKQDHPNFKLATAAGGESPCEDHLNSASATASASSGTKGLRRRPCEDLVENPSPTVAAHGAKAEVRGLNSSASGFPFGYPYAYADPSASASGDYPGKYAYSVEDDGRLVLKVDECVAPRMKFGGINSPKVIPRGVYYTDKVPEIVKVDKSTGELVYLQR